MTAPDQAKAGVGRCDECYYATHMRGGAVISVRQCMICAGIDFDYLARQAEELAAPLRSELAAVTEKARLLKVQVKEQKADFIRSIGEVMKAASDLDIARCAELAEAKRERAQIDEHRDGKHSLNAENLDPTCFECELFRLQFELGCVSDVAKAATAYIAYLHTNPPAWRTHTKVLTDRAVRLLEDLAATVGILTEIRPSTPDTAADGEPTRALEVGSAIPTDAAGPLDAPSVKVEPNDCPGCHGEAGFIAKHWPGCAYLPGGESA